MIAVIFLTLAGCLTLGVSVLILAFVWWVLHEKKLPVLVRIALTLIFIPAMCGFIFAYVMMCITSVAS